MAANWEYVCESFYSPAGPTGITEWLNERATAGYELITAQYTAGPGSSDGSAILFWRRAGQA
jgi:hypothetical protein